MNPISQDSQFEKIGDDRWQLDFADRWSVRDVPNGGYQLAVS